MTDIFYLFGERSNDYHIESITDWKAFLIDEFKKWTGPGWTIAEEYKQKIDFVLKYSLRILATRTEKGSIGSPMYFLFAEFNETDGLVYKMLTNDNPIADQEYFFDSCINI